MALRDGVLAPADVQASLAELTARTCADSVRAHAPDAKLLVVCGGGAFNAHLLARIAAHVAPIPVRTSEKVGIPADQVEASAFAWLASAFLARRPANLPQATGARGGRVLGALYPAG